MLSALLLCATFAVEADTAPVRPSEAPAATAPAAVAPAAARSKRLVADSLVLDKSDRRLTLFRRGEAVETYAVALGKNPVGAKQRLGDGRTPEGLYYIEGRNPESKYHLSLRISYPNIADRRRATRIGAATGGDIMIHGLPKGFATIGALHRQQDWTEGCIAVTNQEIEEIWRAVPNGAWILIRP